MSTEEVKALVEALRVCASAGACKTCERDLYCEPTKMLSDAAAAIEDLQAEVKRQQEKMIELAKKLPKRGEWVEENRRPRSSQFVCSECHRTAYDPQPTRDKAWRKRCRYAYCPNCGAKMEVQDEA